MEETSPLDSKRIVDCLDRFVVQYLLVVGVGALMHGATRPTRDVDSLKAVTSFGCRHRAAAAGEYDEMRLVSPASPTRPAD